MDAAQLAAAEEPRAAAAESPAERTDPAAPPPATGRASVEPAEPAEPALARSPSPVPRPHQAPPAATPPPAAPAESTSEEGLLSGRFRLHEPIEETAIGEVWSADDTRGNVTVHVLHVAPEVFASPLTLERTQRELRQLERGGGEGIGRVLDHGKLPDGRLWVASEVPGGRGLDDVVRDSGPLGYRRACEIVVRIGEALLEAQKSGVIHRDVQPGNVRLLDGDHVEVIRFGVARRVTSRVFGEPQYLSPEQADGRPVDQRSNIYSLGAILHLLLTGRPPIEGEDHDVLGRLQVAEAPIPSRISPQFTKGLDALFAKAMARSPTRRHLTLRQFVRDLGELAKATAGREPSVPAPAAASRPARTLLAGAGVPAVGVPPLAPVGTSVEPPVAAEPAARGMPVVPSIPSVPAEPAAVAQAVPEEPVEPAAEIPAAPAAPAEPVEPAAVAQAAPAELVEPAAEIPAAPAALVAQTPPVMETAPPEAAPPSGPTPLASPGADKPALAGSATIIAIAPPTPEPLRVKPVSPEATDSRDERKPAASLAASPERPSPATATAGTTDSGPPRPSGPLPKAKPLVHIEPTSALDQPGREFRETTRVKDGARSEAAARNVVGEAADEHPLEHRGDGGLAGEDAARPSVERDAGPEAALTSIPARKLPGERMNTVTIAREMNASERLFVRLVAGVVILIVAATAAYLFLG